MLSRAELLEMLGAEGSAQRDLHARAAAIRDRVFDRAVVVRGGSRWVARGASPRHPN